MANFNQSEAESSTVIRASILNSVWTVVVTDADSNSYVLKFAGLEADTDETLSNAIYDELLLTEKRAAFVPDVPVSRATANIAPLATI